MRQGISWYRMSNFFYRWMHYFWCRFLCRKHKSCREWRHWSRVGVSIQYFVRAIPLKGLDVWLYAKGH